MNAFENRIKEQQAGPYRIPEHRWPELTIGDLIGSVLAIDGVEEAKEYFEHYCLWLANHPNEKHTPQEVARMNIGWCFGEGMTDAKRNMWVEVCGAAHPVFGTMATAPTAREAYEAGLAAGAKL